MPNTKNSSKKLDIANILVAAAFLAGMGYFVARFGGPQLLRMYVTSGIGSCSEIPILCLQPSQAFTDPPIDDTFKRSLLTYEFDKIVIAIPEGFRAVQERVQKVYYYGNVKRPREGTVVYLLYQEPGYFVKLFPRLPKECITDDHEFLRRTMHADLNNIRSLADAFFVITKGVFIPDLGDQKTVTMAEFTLHDKRGFINYNRTPEGNFFDCNVFDAQRNYFKVYIKDVNATLDLPDVFAIISTIRHP